LKQDLLPRRPSFVHNSSARKRAQSGSNGWAISPQKSGWRIAEAPRRLRLDTHKPCRRKIQFIDEGV
jgi:hypothetical protein